MNNEPVAWINRHMDDGWLSWDKDSNADSSTPLYTHPAKTLTDEEIIEFIKSWEGLVVTNRTMEMFRAILKKASEK